MLGVTWSLSELGSFNMQPERSACSANADQLVGLERQPPLRMFQAIGGRGLGIGGAIRIVHRLQEEMAEILAGIALRRRAACG